MLMTKKNKEGLSKKQQTLEKNKDRDQRFRMAAEHERIRKETDANMELTSDAAIDVQGKHIEANTDAKISNWRKRTGKAKSRARKRSRTIFR